MKYDVVSVEGFDSESDATLVYVDGELKAFTDKGQCDEIARILRPDATFHSKELGGSYPKKLSDILKWKDV